MRSKMWLWLGKCLLGRSTRYSSCQADHQQKRKRHSCDISFTVCLHCDDRLIALFVFVSRPPSGSKKESEHEKNSRQLNFPCWQTWRKIFHEDQFCRATTEETKSCPGWFNERFFVVLVRYHYRPMFSSRNCHVRHVSCIQRRTPHQGGRQRASLKIRGRLCCKCSAKAGCSLLLLCNCLDAAALPCSAHYDNAKKQARTIKNIHESP